jgi:NitT/TauT family transport system ATP-binding protein
MARAPLVRAICNSLKNNGDGSLSEDFFLDMLRSGFTEEKAHRQLDVAINWGRYAELYSFEANTGQLKLDHLPDADAKGRRRPNEACPCREPPARGLTEAAPGDIAASSV